MGQASFATLSPPPPPPPPPSTEIPTVQDLNQSYIPNIFPYFLHILKGQWSAAQLLVFVLNSLKDAYFFRFGFW